MSERRRNWAEKSRGYRKEGVGVFHKVVASPQRRHRLSEHL